MSTVATASTKPAAIKRQWSVTPTPEGQFIFKPLPLGSPRTIITAELAGQIFDMDPKLVAALKQSGLLQPRYYLDTLSGILPDDGQVRKGGQP